MSPRDSKSSNRPSPRARKPELDPRFPSGEWKGFWIQRGIDGRQWMRLALEFSEGTISGEGRDMVGPFVMSGTYNLKSGRCHLVKAHIAQHQVSYEGFNDGQRLWLWGTWKLPDDRGGFHIWPKGEPDPTGSTLKAHQDVPAEEERVLVTIGEELQ
ncbi:MAG TPA: hypothetical protein VFW23_01805 [Tepidisphaeraceae bacterium]|nr:hypothetical protein [Tepidisphaeraceae bacterium]